MSRLIAEALSAATLQGAYALRDHEARGSLEPGKAADFLVLSVPDYRQIVYAWGVNHVETVVKDGRIVAAGGRVQR